MRSLGSEPASAERGPHTHKAIFRGFFPHSLLLYYRYKLLPVTIAGNGSLCWSYNDFVKRPPLVGLHIASERKSESIVGKKNAFQIKPTTAHHKSSTVKKYIYNNKFTVLDWPHLDAVIPLVIELGVGEVLWQAEL